MPCSNFSNQIDWLINFIKHLSGRRSYWYEIFISIIIRITAKRLFHAICIWFWIRRRLWNGVQRLSWNIIETNPYFIWGFCCQLMILSCYVRFPISTNGRIKCSNISFLSIHLQICNLSTLLSSTIEIEKSQTLFYRLHFFVSFAKLSIWNRKHVQFITLISADNWMGDNHLKRISIQKLLNWWRWWSEQHCHLIEMEWNGME